jgi:Protein of unknown function (DUF3298)
MVAGLSYFMFVSLATLFISCDKIISENYTLEPKPGNVILTDLFCKRFEGKVGYHIIIMNWTLLDTTPMGNNMPELTKITENRFSRLFNISANQDLKIAGFFFNKGIFELNDNHSSNNYGIIFQFNPYEVVAYVYRASEFTLPYSEIKDLIKPVSILGKILN